MDYPREFHQWRTTLSGRQIEKVTFALWDTATYTSAATVRLEMFTSVRATKDLSNVAQTGMLPAGTGMLIESIRFIVKNHPRSTTAVATGTNQTGAIDDIMSLINTGWFTLVIGSKQYAQFPLHMLPSGSGVYGGGTGVTTWIDWGSNGMPDPRAVYSLPVPLFIEPGIQVVATCEWAAALTLAGGNTPVSIVLDGEQVRPTQ